MAYDDDSLDCVLDKATLDTMCQLDDDPTAGEGTHANKMLRESCRVLKPGGHYVCLTYGEPESRLGMLTAEGLRRMTTKTKKKEKRRRRRRKTRPGGSARDPEEQGCVLDVRDAERGRRRRVG